jgi:Xaa-Pro aminopeptidase
MQAEYRQRREQLMSKIGTGIAIFAVRRWQLCITMLNMLSDRTVIFYLTGFNEPEAVAILMPDHQEHRFVLFVQQGT